MIENETPGTRDSELWRIAKKRAGFKRGAIAYLLVNTMLWAIWYVTDSSRGFSRNSIPWPIWSTVFWGVGLAFQYAGAYIYPGAGSAEREYQKLKQQENRN